MKSERRHELQHNELATWIIKSAQAVQPYQNLILPFVVITAVAIAGYMWWSRNNASQTAQAWKELNQGFVLCTSARGGSLELLQKVADEHPDTEVGYTADILMADLRLASGCQQLFTNKPIGEQELSRAIELYETALKQNQSPMLLERATFGMARAKESKGDLDTAQRYYHDIVENWPRGAYSEVARQRLADLKRPEIKQMYDDFAKYVKPAAVASPSGAAEMPAGELPGLPPEAAQKANSKELPGLPAEPTPNAKPNDKKPDDNKKLSKDQQKPDDNKKPSKDQQKPADNKKPAGEKTGGKAGK